MRPFRLLLILILFVINGKVYSQCNTPVISGLSNIFYDNVRVNYTCCQTGTYYLEYGLTGFTPGTNAAPGTGGTVIQASANPGSQVISGLLSTQVYDVYVRVACTAGGWTSNSAVKTFRPGIPCSTAQQISCGTDYQVVLPAGLGAWNNWFCVFQGGLGREKLYRFTPTVTGNYFFHAGNSSGSNNRVTFRYRSDTLPCNEANWTCLLTAQPGAPASLQFGPLIAGKTYLILADASTDTIPPDTATFRIECPQVSCPTPTGFSVSSPYVGEIVVNFSGSTSYFEFGPPGFTPGQFNFPGNGGNVIPVNDGSVLSGYGLTSGIAYHGYLRTECQLGSLSYYSQNAGPFWFMVKPCNPLWTYDPSTGPLWLVFNGWMSMQDNYNRACNNLLPTGGGDDVRFQFVCPKTGSYTAFFDLTNNNLGFGMKPYSTACFPNNYTCLNLTSNTGTSPYFASLGVLQKDSIYDFIIDTQDSTETWLDFKIECESPGNITANNVGPTSFDLNWSCNCTDTVFVEIGPQGFTPGTGYAPGTGGTLLLASGNSFSISNLQPFTRYDVYLRTSCGTFFSSNKGIPVFTPKQCQQAPVVTCGDNVNFVFTSAPNYNPQGPWGVQACGTGGSAEEFIFRFTPTQSGMHKIQVYGMTSNWTGVFFSAKFFFKNDSLGCTPNDWNCIGEVYTTLPAFTPQEFLFGPLTAGETYYIMTDGVNSLYRYHTFYARILCPGVCSGPFITGVAPVHPNSAMVYGSCNSCAPNTMIEIGPQGFTPGTGSLPGTNGTVYQNVTFPYTVNGLNAGTTYDVYVRSDCSTDTTGFTSGFSINSGPLHVTPCSVIPDPITSSIGSNIICQGQSVTLYRNGGIAAPGAVYRWYENWCGSGNFIGLGDSIVVAPSNTTTYYLRTEAPCGNTNCVSVQIQVDNAPPAFAGNTSFCAGDSTTLSVLIPFQQYLWNTGDTTSGITVSNPGLYSLTAINSNGCQVSGSVAVTEISFSPPQISGNTALCVGDSSVLFAGNGYATYLWSDGSSNPFITIGDSGTYAVTVSNAFGCSGTDSVHVSLHQPPSVSITAQSSLSFCIGDSVLLTTTPGLVGWQWYRSQNPITGATDHQLWIKSAGSYFCIGSDAFECADTSNILTATTRCIIIGSPQDKTNMPQPFYATVLSGVSGESPVIKVQCPENTQIDFQLYDSLGKLVSVSADIVQTGTYRLSFSGKAGIYILQVRCGNELRNLKLIR